VLERLVGRGRGERGRVPSGMFVVARIIPVGIWVYKHGFRDVGVIVRTHYEY